MSDEKIVDRVRALLAKAERTDNPHEAEVFSAKAAELIDRHRIDLAKLEPDQEYVRSIFQLWEYKHLRASLSMLGLVAVHFGVVVTIPATGNSKRPMLIGTKGDIEATVGLFRSLAIQRDRACVAAGMRGIKERNSFAYGYASRIGARLAELRHRQTREARTEGNTTALVVYSREAQVTRWLEEEAGAKLGSVGHNRPRLDFFAAMDGDEAARRADIGQDRVGPGRAGALHS